MKSFMFFAPLALWAGTAAATPGFPAAITGELQLDYQPPCNVCHETTSGGGPMATRFGRALVDRGLRAYDDASLRDSLARLDADGVDSNGNGSSDVDDLREGIDPNSSSSQSLTSAPAIEYGCVGRVSRSPPYGGATVASIVLVCSVLLLGSAAHARRSPRRSERL